MFISGIIVGILLAVLIIVTLIFFRTSVEHIVKTSIRMVDKKSPRETGAIFIPEDEADIARQKHINENNKRGIDTPLKDLR